MTSNMNDSDARQEEEQKGSIGKKNENFKGIYVSLDNRFRRFDLETLLDAGSFLATRRFEKWGMVNLLALQIQISDLEMQLERSARMAREGHETDGESVRRDFRALLEVLRNYNHCLLEQRQVLRLPKFDEKALKVEESFKFRNFKQKFAGDSNYDHDFVSLDCCASLTNCPQLSGISDVLKWPPPMPNLTKSLKENTMPFLKWLCGFFLPPFLALLPAGSILILYVIPTSHQRLWEILGESVFLICLIILLKGLKKEQFLAYMPGMAAVQVVFVGFIVSG